MRFRPVGIVMANLALALVVFVVVNAEADGPAKFLAREYDNGITICKNLEAYIVRDQDGSLLGKHHLKNTWDQIEAKHGLSDTEYESTRVVECSS